MCFLVFSWVCHLRQNVGTCMWSGTAISWLLSNPVWLLTLRKILNSGSIEKKTHFSVKEKWKFSKRREPRKTELFENVRINALYVLCPFSKDNHPTWHPFSKENHPIWRTPSPLYMLPNTLSPLLLIFLDINLDKQPQTKNWFKMITVSGIHRN